MRDSEHAREGGRPHRWGILALVQFVVGLGIVALAPGVAWGGSTGGSSGGGPLCPVAPPTSTAAPTISGPGARVEFTGSTLNTTNGGWSSCPPITAYQYKWQRDDGVDSYGNPKPKVDIAGATNASFVPGADLNVHTVSSAVSACNEDGCSPYVPSSNGLFVAVALRSVLLENPSFHRAWCDAGLDDSLTNCSGTSWSNNGNEEQAISNAVADAKSMGFTSIVVDSISSDYSGATFTPDPKYYDATNYNDPNNPSGDLSFLNRFAAAAAATNMKLIIALPIFDPASATADTCGEAGNLAPGWSASTSQDPKTWISNVLADLSPNA